MELHGPISIFDIRKILLALAIYTNVGRILIYAVADACRDDWAGEGVVFVRLGTSTLGGGPLYGTLRSIPGACLVNSDHDQEAMHVVDHPNIAIVKQIGESRRERQSIQPAAR
jgi:hypothetical protein